MIIQIISFIIAVISLIAILVIVIRKFPALASIDINSIPEVKESQIKNRLLNERLARKASERVASFENLVKPVWYFFQKRFRSLYQRMFDLERKYRRKHKPLVGKRELAQSVQEMLKKGYGFIESGAYASAEKQFIEIISLDKKNIDAYNALAELYSVQKEYQGALEVLEYVSKLQLHDIKVMSQLAELSEKRGEEAQAEGYRQKIQELQSKQEQTFLELGFVYKSLDQLEKSFNYYQKAVELSPNNPRYLDLYLEQAIALGKKVDAVNIFEKLQEVNPQNQKLHDFGNRIKEM